MGTQAKSISPFKKAAVAISGEEKILNSYLSLSIPQSLINFAIPIPVGPFITPILILTSSGLYREHETKTVSASVSVRINAMIFFIV